MSVGLGGWRPANHHTLHHRRRGSIYVMVLGTSLVVTVIGLSALTITRIERRSAESTGDFAQARLYAQSAIDMGRLRIRNDPDWRTSYTNGDWEIRRAIGSGTYTVGGYDPVDGILDDGSSDPLILKGIGFEGAARYQLQVQLEAQGQALTCLEVALHTGDNLLFSGSTAQCDQVISSNNNIDATSCDIFSEVQVVGSASGGTYWITPITGITPRTMPDSTVFDYYIANGTPIDVGLLPKIGPTPAIKEVVLSPASNPYGPTNPEGIYVIDLMGQQLKFRKCRIVGTIVLLNGTADCTTLDWINWEPAVANYPSLMVRGDFIFNTDSTQPLVESSPTNVNYNPIGTPYNGDEDDLIDDTYPTVFGGLYYVSGSASIATGSHPAFDGVFVVGNTLTTNGDVTLTYRSTFLSNPPPGFGSAVKMSIVPGTWKQTVN
ncbi:MAG: hypothetical protein IID35_02605 [Planctomycetes bacterium]|nr:hypothetical protein [Planctomycetota bacterium]